MAVFSRRVPIQLNEPKTLLGVPSVALNKVSNEKDDTKDVDSMVLRFGLDLENGDVSDNAAITALIEGQSFTRIGLKLDTSFWLKLTGAACFGLWPRIPLRGRAMNARRVTMRFPSTAPRPGRSLNAMTRIIISACQEFPSAGCGDRRPRRLAARPSMSTSIR